MIYNILRYLLFAFTITISIQVFSNENKEILCSQLSDQYCKDLWSAENLGNYTLPDGSKILTGKVESKLISNAEYIYYKNLIKRASYLPSDLKSKLQKKNTFNKMKQHFVAINNPLFSNTESKRRAWTRKLDDLILEYKRSLSDTVYERFFRKLPNIKNKLWTNYSDYEKKSYYEIFFNLSSEIMDSVYLNSQAWISAKKIFNQAKEDLLNILNTLNLPSSIKSEMRAKLQTVSLSLPYRDPRKIGSNKSCATTSDNGYYSPSRHKFTLCIGKLNTIQSEGGLYGTISHEIAHSIDPMVFSINQFRKSGLSKLAAKIYNENGNLSCKLWQKEKNNFFKSSTDFYQLPKKYEQLTQCLVDRSRLDKLDQKSLLYSSKRLAEKAIDQSASNKSFTYISQKQIVKDGRIIDNEVYLNPQKFAARANSYLPEFYYSKGEFFTSAFFVQELKCQKNTAERFKNSITETLRLRKIFYQNRLSYTGQNSSALKNYNLSLPAGEDFADWLSHKATKIFLSRYKSIEKRRSLLLARHTTFCTPSGLELIAPKKVVDEKKFSRRPHPLGRKRRLRYFTKPVAKLLSCQRGPEIKKIDINCDEGIITK